MPRTVAGIWKRRDSPYWQISYVGSDGRRKCRSSKTRVYKEARELMDRLRSGEPETETVLNAAPTLEAFGPIYLESLISNERRPATVESAAGGIRNLSAAFGHKPLDRITMAEVDGFKRRRRAQGVSARTVNRELTTLGSLLRRAIGMGAIHRLPCPIEKLRSDKRTERRTLSALERDKLFRACRNPRERAMLMLALETGLRRSELTWLRWGDVDEARRRVIVRPKVDGHEAWSPKGRAERHIPLTDAAFAALAAYRKADRGRAAWVFPGRKGGRFRSPAKAMRLLFQRAGVYESGSVLHSLRHTFASEALAAGADLATVKELLGHANIATTQIYTHSTEERKREAVERLGLGTGAAKGATRTAAPRKKGPPVKGASRRKRLK